MTKRRLIIACEDPSHSKRLCDLVQALPDFQAIAVTSDLMETYVSVEEQQPAAVLISDTMSLLPEFEVMRGLFQTLDVRWLIIKSGADRRDRALHGADLFAVPREVSAEDLGQRLRALTRGTRSALSSPSAARQADVSVVYDRVVLIGASTGGIDALLAVLRVFPSDCPPTVIVQHTGPGFGKSLARLLDNQCPPDVHLVEHQARLAPGRVLIGAGIRTHLQFKDTKPDEVIIKDGANVCGHKPSIDVMFQSARPFAQKVAAALLTGMGRDGAQGMFDLHRAGARTIAQDEKTSVVYGMPRAAAEMGAADKTLPLDQIGPALLAASRASSPRSKERIA